MSKLKIKTVKRVTRVELNEEGQKKVKVAFTEITPRMDGVDDDVSAEDIQAAAEVLEALTEEESLVYANDFSFSAEHEPHKDFIVAMNKLKKHALEICEINDTETTNYNVLGFKISGDMMTKKSRVTFTVLKFVERTSKLIKFNTPQVAMYGKSDYDKAPQLTKAIEECIEEAWAYVSGKYADKNGQLPLFERTLMKVA